MPKPIEILKEYWGFPGFRPLQEEIIQSVLDGKDTLALLPTGGGKSVCYQVPALCQKGVCIVVSPLIALMKDQVSQLQKRNIPATAIYSGLSYQEMDRLFDNCIYGNTKLLYLSPERLGTQLARERIRKMHVNLLAIDEAHCVSQWGYDFRPAYLEIASIRELLPDVPLLALTATATVDVVEDLQQQLAFKKDARVFKKSFVRPNLAYVVLHEEQQLEKLREIFQKVKGSGLVYVRNRRKTKDIAAWLHRRGIVASNYHAGLEPAERSRRQEAWMRGDIRVMVATNAFGMGIDKPDVRLVVHLDMPDSPEAYFQEAGRAGRDGEKSFAILLFHKGEKIRLQQYFENSYPPLEEVKRVYQALGSYFQLAVGSGLEESFDFDLVNFCRTFKFDVIRTLSSLRILEQSGWLTLTESVFVPSSFRILVGKDALYDYQLKNKQFDRLLKTLLRTHSGSFKHPVRLQESQLAAFLKISRAQIVKAMQHFHREGILEYHPPKDQPQLVFLQARVDMPSLVLDYRLYNFRKNRHLERMKKMFSYVENPVCRSVQLVEYFGEQEVEVCGICDVCLGRTKPQLQKGDRERLSEKVRLLLEKEQLTERELLACFSGKQKAKIALVLEYLLEEEWILPEEGKLIWQKD